MTKSFHACLILLLLALPATLCAQQSGAPVQQLMQQYGDLIAKSSRKTIGPAIDALAASGLAEAQTVMALRLFGMAGLWPLGPGEHRRMMAEKWSAFTASGTAAGIAAMQGQSPDRVATEALRPIRRVTKANSKRLSRKRRVK